MKKNVLEYLKQTTEKFPDKIAIIDSQKEITFRDFYTKALNFSTHMLEITPPPPARV
ncbi:hypothetical protein Q5I06_02755 [Helicobacter sp. faydin-H76]|uniref:Uncharacterized protein n=1 Tax=Helicobacter cappadocius TaxID=3063998 RepID=A0AA90T4T4_9HELI|nr:hypothetical protein [Helicobacter sp. faydin-H76]MDP2538703.1 hypothetical protein [Helicobacter sp. faydin-H76]